MAKIAYFWITSNIFYWADSNTWNKLINYINKITIKVFLGTSSI